MSSLKTAQLLKKATEGFLGRMKSTLRKSHTSGFTLMELIIVIVILAILATIAFISYQGYSANSRDSARASDITNLSKSLELALIRNNSYPTPDNSFAVTYSGGVLWNQGTIGSSAMTMLGAGGKVAMSKKPTDPLTSKEYTYSTLKYGKGFQIQAGWEGDSVAMLPSVVPEAFAATNSPTLAYVKGSYNGVVLKTTTSSGISCLVATPSIVSNTGSTDIEITSNNIFSGSLVVYKGNITGSAFKASLTGSSSPVVYCSGALPSNSAEQQQFAVNLANAYSGTSFATNPHVQPFITALTASNSGAQLASLGGNLINSVLNGTAPTTAVATQTCSGTGYANGDCNTRLITISANKLNLNAYNECIAAFSTGACATGNFKIVISSGVTISSNNVDVPGFTTGTGWAGGTILTIENYGYIIGGGGPNYTDRTLNQAYAGGTALATYIETNIVNYSNIIGGAGSGGPGEGDSCGGCGGGNGGSSGGAGGAAIITYAKSTITNSGAIYGGGGGGAGGGGGYAAGVGSGNGGRGAGAMGGFLYPTLETRGCTSYDCGGNGGDYGLPGNAGDAGYNGAGNGGAGGYAIILNGNQSSINGTTVVANSSYTVGTWITGTKGRIGS